jgi:hypothetical protein
MRYLFLSDRRRMNLSYIKQSCAYPILCDVFALTKFNTDLTARLQWLFTRCERCCAVQGNHARTHERSGESTARDEKQAGPIDRCSNTKTVKLTAKDGTDATMDARYSRIQRASGMIVSCGSRRPRSIGSLRCTIASQRRLQKCPDQTTPAPGSTESESVSFRTESNLNPPIALSGRNRVR